MDAEKPAFGPAFLCLRVQVCESVHFAYPQSIFGCKSRLIVEVDWKSKLQSLDVRIVGELAFRTAVRMLPMLVDPKDIVPMGRTLLIPLFRGLAIAKIAEQLPVGQFRKLDEFSARVTRFSLFTTMLGFEDIEDRETAVRNFFNLCRSRSQAHLPQQIIDRYEETKHKLHPDSDAHTATSDAGFIVNQILESVSRVLNWIPPQADFLRQSFEADLRLVEAGGETFFLPIWQEGCPDEWNRHWFEVKAVLTRNRAQESWYVWTDWYAAILEGSSIDEELEPAKAEPSFDADQSSQPSYINSDIAERLGILTAATSTRSVGHEFTDKTKSSHDAPTTNDRLGRLPFARKLVEVIEDQRSESGSRIFDFAIHLYAPWGLGKSSVIEMMTEQLEDHTREGAENWAVFTFNAWAHEHRKRPWWPFLACLHEASLRQKCRQGKWVSVVWTFLWWWARRLLDWIGSFTLALAAVAVLYWVSVSFGWFPNDGEGVDWQAMVGGVTGSLTLIVALTSHGSRLLFGPKDQTDFYSSLSRNPWKRVRTRFRDLAGKLNRPVCIFIDDLDRCQASYVVDVLTGIQTHFRKDNVVYVVAADRKWLRTSFETAYKDFVDKSGQKEDRLGYLFLEKVFQLSVPLPRIPAYYREAYIRELLNDEEVAALDAGSVEDGAVFDAQMKAHRQGGDAAPDTPHDMPEESEVDERGASPARPSAKEAERKTIEALEKSASKEEASAVKHRLRDLIDCFPSNPRVIKRVINAYGVHMFEAFFEDIDVSEERRDLIARWAILEQCYPALIDILIDEPELAEHFNPMKGELPRLSADSEFKRFFDLLPVKALFVDGETFHLTPDVVREFTEGQRG